MNKKIVFLIGIIALGVTFSGCLNKDTSVKDDKNDKGGITVSSTAGKDGTFEGEGEGFDGKTKISLEIKDGMIKKIDVISSKDDESYLNEAKKLIPKIIEKQSSEVDSISGATFSSKGIISAVENALKNSK